MTIGSLLRYGYTIKTPEPHPDYGSIQTSKWLTGVALIIRERKVKQHPTYTILYKTLRDSGNFSSIAKPQEYDTYYTVMLPGGEERELYPPQIQELL